MVPEIQGPEPVSYTHLIVISQKNHFFKPCKTCVKALSLSLQFLENKHFLESYQYIAMADEKHFNHSFISPSFAPECPVLQGVMGGMVKCSEITDCGKTEQN